MESTSKAKSAEEDSKNGDLDNKMDQTDPQPKPENDTSETQFDSTPQSNDDSEEDSPGKACSSTKDDDHVTSEQSPDSSPTKSKKKVRFLDDAGQKTKTPVNDKQNQDPKTDAADKPKEEVRAKSNLRKLAEIKIDLSKLLPASIRIANPVPGKSRTLREILKPRISRPRIKFPVTRPKKSKPKSSLLNYTPPPPPGRLIPFPVSPDMVQLKPPTPRRRQFPQLFDEDSYVKAFCRDIPNIDIPIEYERLFENIPRANVGDTFEWDFDEIPITDRSKSENNIAPRATTAQLKLTLEDNDPPHIFDPDINSYIPLNNGDQIEVVADIHDAPSGSYTTRERTTENVNRPVLIPAEREDLEAIEFIPCDETPREMARDVDFDEAAFQDWVTPPSPNLPDRRHSF